MSLFWELYQQSRISQAQGRAEAAEGRASRADREVGELRQQVERLSLGCQAMWELLRDKLDMTDEYILKKIAEVDVRDGMEDGRIAGRVRTCGECGRPAGTQRSVCMYCGADLDKPHVFE